MFDVIKFLHAIFNRLGRPGKLESTESSGQKAVTGDDVHQKYEGNSGTDDDLLVTPHNQRQSVAPSRRNNVENVILSSNLSDA